MLVLDDYVSEGSDLIDFTRVVRELRKGMSTGVLVYSENLVSQALKIYCQFNASGSFANNDHPSFLGHPLKFKIYKITIR